MLIPEIICSAEILYTAENSAKIQLFNLKGDNNILYRLFTCKVRYFKPLFVIIWMIMAYKLETFSQQCNF